MRIGIDARLINQTGVGRYTRELMENLSKIDDKNKYTIFLRKKEFQGFQPALLRKALLAGKFQIKEINIRWHSFKEQLILPWILWREHLDLIHFPYFSVPIFYPGKFVVTIHDLILDHFDTGKASTLPWIIYKIKRLGYKLVMWITLFRAIKIITVSEATKKEIVDHYKIKPNKIAVIYEAGANTEGADTVPPLRCEPDNKYLLYVGNAYPHKNLEKLCEAFQKVKIAIQNLKLVLVGNEDYFYKRLKDKVEKLGLEGKVVFYGPATKDELTGLYKNAIALVFPSLMEGFGLPAVEGMANNCLVLCSDIPVFHEILGEAAVYFDPNDVSDMSYKIYEVIKNPQKFQSLKLKGLKQAKQYSWEKLARETLEIYKQLI